MLTCVFLPEPNIKPYAKRTTVLRRTIKQKHKTELDILRTKIKNLMGATVLC